MITMNELVDLRMQQHIAHEIYRQQIMQRIPDPFPAMLPVPIPRHIMLPPRVTLPGVEANLQNNDLWKQFHQIGTEMIITKSGRRMFPSMRLSLSGLEDEANYCVLLEMVPIGDCRYKFSGSQWVPAGGAEPQSPQRMYLHPDSPALGSHWQAQPILFNKVKLTNNTLDNNGHVVLTSMHKYQPRIHIIRTSDPTQIPWAPQQAFIFPETEFVAVTAYQNDRITKLKIDNNPFAKGFRETGQSRCKRKMGSTGSQGVQQSGTVGSPIKTSHSSEKTRSDDGGFDLDNGSTLKRMRSDSSACSVSSLDDSGLSVSGSSSGTSSPANTDDLRTHHPVTSAANIPAMAAETATAMTSRNEFFFHQIHQNIQSFINPSLVDLACSYFDRSPYAPHFYPPHLQAPPTALSIPCQLSPPIRRTPIHPHGGYFMSSPNHSQTQNIHEQQHLTGGGSPAPADIPPNVIVQPFEHIRVDEESIEKTPKKNSFTISAILGNDK